MRSFVPDFDLVPASSLGEALARLNDGWRPIAGGTDLMVLFNAGKLPYRKLVGIRRIPELRDIAIHEAEISIGAAVSYTEIRHNDTLQRQFPLLCSAASWTGSIANQNRGTLGGNIVNASPSADSAPALLVYDAELQLASVNGSRLIPYREFHLGYKQMQRRDDELVTTIHLPRTRDRWHHYARKVGPRKAQAISKVALAAAAIFDGSRIEDIRIAGASAAPVPLRCFATESVLRGQTLSPSLIQHAAKTIAAEVQPITDIRSTESYRRMVTANLLKEFLESHDPRRVERSE